MRKSETTGAKPPASSEVLKMWRKYVVSAPSACTPVPSLDGPDAEHAVNLENAIER